MSAEVFFRLHVSWLLIMKQKVLFERTMNMIILGLFSVKSLDFHNNLNQEKCVNS